MDIIKEFRKNPSKELYKNILDKYIKNYKVCRICGEPIYYYDSIARCSRNNTVYLDNKSYLTNKVIDGISYNLSVCEDCLSKKYPEYVNKNKSRVFNMVNPITAYAFNIPDSIWKKWKDKNYSRTLENYINKFGKEEGLKRWNQYCKKQSESNSFEYKNKKHGWNKEKFNEFNKSRAVTLNNLVNKHGNENGLEIWNNYLERQRYTTSKKYFIEEYGKIEGLEKWNNWQEKIIFLNGCSKISQEFFKELDKKLNNYTTYYQEKNHEWCVRNKEKCCFLDYYIKELNITIEFNGDLWHANPNKYNENDNPLPFNRELKAKDIWNKDKERCEFLEKQDIKTIVIWESDFYRDGIIKSTEKIIKKIDDRKL
jgi:hypothetical protein